jgi:hypothetical protein
MARDSQLIGSRVTWTRVGGSTFRRADWSNRPAMSQGPFAFAALA